MEYSTVIKGAGVDWLTVTAHESPKRDLLREWGIETMMEDASAGNKVTPFAMRGWRGGGTRHVQVGEKGGAVIVRLMGGIAIDKWADALEVADHCSRIDLQTTVKQEPFDPHLPMECWALASETRTKQGRPPQLDLYARAHRGETLYVGDRSSRLFARLYNRHAKTGLDEDKDCWRYEVEAKRERAVQIAGLLGQAEDPAQLASALVFSHFDARGVVPIYEPRDVANLPPLPPDESDDERSLRWLRSSCRPVLERLHAHGHDGDLCRSLGLATLGFGDGCDEPDEPPHP